MRMKKWIKDEKMAIPTEYWDIQRDEGFSKEKALTLELDQQ